MAAGSRDGDSVVCWLTRQIDSYDLPGASLGSAKVRDIKRVTDLFVGRVISGRQTVILAADEGDQCT